MTEHDKLERYERSRPNGSAAESRVVKVADSYEILEPQDSPDFRAYARILRKRLPTVLIVFSILFGVGLMALDTAQGLLPQRWGYTAPLPPFGTSVGPLASTAFVVTRWVSALYTSLQTVLLVAMIFVVLRLVLRRGWLAALVGVVILTVLSDNGAAFFGTWFDLVLIPLTFVVVTFGMFRFGLLVMTVAAFANKVATGLPLTLNLSAWWATPSMLSLALLIGLALFAFYAARAGKPLFGNLEVRSLKSEV